LPCIEFFPARAKLNLAVRMDGPVLEFAMAKQLIASSSAVRNFYVGLTLLVIATATALHSAGAYAADASLHQVYEAANAGNYQAAQSMMDQVLRDHPASAKAHFVEAELLAKQGQLTKSASELRTAEKLDPALAFAKPAAIQELKSMLAAPSHAAAFDVAPASPARPAMPWGIIIAAGLLTAALFFFLRSRRQTQTYIPASRSAFGNGYGPVPYSGQTPYGPTPMGPAAGQGMGSSILGGLATGAAVGAGMVAGEALMHRVFDGGHSSNAANTSIGQDLGPSDNFNGDAERRYDMGGNDFGVNDTSSWDDSSGGGDDWS
jgi:hypothetical protein